jgi:hypothetical protein
MTPVVILGHLCESEVVGGSTETLQVSLPLGFEIGLQIVCQ